MKLVQKMMNRAGIAASSLVLAAPAFAGTTGTAPFLATPDEGRRLKK